MFYFPTIFKKKEKNLFENPFLNHNITQENKEEDETEEEENKEDETEEEENKEEETEEEDETGEEDKEDETEEEENKEEETEEEDETGEEEDFKKEIMDIYNRIITYLKNIF